MAILSSTGWNQSFLDAFQGIGQIAAAVQYQQSGAAKTAQESQEAEKQKQYELFAKKQTEGYEQKTSAIASIVDIEKIKTFFVSNWLIILAAVLLLLVITGKIRLPFLKRKNNPGNKRGRRSTRKTVTRVRGGRKIKRTVTRGNPGTSSGFSRKIKGVVYTSKKAWAEKMQSLRKKK